MGDLPIGYIELDSILYFSIVTWFSLRTNCTKNYGAIDFFVHTIIWIQLIKKT